MAEAVIYGVIWGLCVALLSSIAASLVCLFSSDSDRLTAPLATASGIIAHFVAGFICAKKKKTALPTGIISGGCLALIFFIISLFFGESYSYGLGMALSLLIRISMVAVSVFAAMLGANTGEKRRRRR